MMRILLIALAAFASLFAAGEYADPAPSWETPRQIVFDISEMESKETGGPISNVNNVIKGYGADKVEAAVVVWGPALKHLLKSDKLMAARFKALQLLEVEIVACGNTMETYHIKKEELIDGVETVKTGLIEVIERKKSGWTHIKL